MKSVKVGFEGMPHRRRAWQNEPGYKAKFDGSFGKDVFDPKTMTEIIVFSSVKGEVYLKMVLR